MIWFKIRFLVSETWLAVCQLLVSHLNFIVPPSFFTRNVAYKSKFKLKPRIGNVVALLFGRSLDAVWSRMVWRWFVSQSVSISILDVLCGFCFDICISLSFSLRFVAQRQKSIKIVVCANYIRVSSYIHFGYSRDMKTKTGQTDRIK